MKKNITTIIIITALVLGGYALFKNTNGADDQVATVMPRNDLQNEIAYSENSNLVNGNYEVRDGTTISWSAKNSLRSHTGTLTLDSGTITVLDSSVTGSFTARIASLTSDGGEVLNNHLKSEDFFDASNYPTANLVITGYINGGFQGELTIKETTLPIIINGSIVQESDEEIAVSFSDSFDRSLWDVRYGSLTFFDNLGDSAIDDDVIISGDLRLYKN